METHMLFSVSELEADVENAESALGFLRQAGTGMMSRELTGTSIK
jgi:hypothetical protein